MANGNYWVPPPISAYLGATYEPTFEGQHRPYLETSKFTPGGLPMQVRLAAGLPPEYGMWEPTVASARMPSHLQGAIEAGAQIPQEILDVVARNQQYYGTGEWYETPGEAQEKELAALFADWAQTPEGKAVLALPPAPLQTWAGGVAPGGPTQTWSGQGARTPSRNWIPDWVYQADLDVPNVIPSGRPEGLNLYELMREMEEFYPPLTLTPEEQYQLTMPGAYQERAQQLRGTLPTDIRMYKPTFGRNPLTSQWGWYQQAPEAIGTLDPVSTQIQNLANVAGRWAPGGEIGRRRTLEQQREYERQMEGALRWGADEPPLPPDPTAYWRVPEQYDEAYRGYQQEMSARQTQEKAWNLWQPVFKQMFAPETFKGGGLEAMKPPVGQSLAPAPSRRRSWQPYQGMGSSFSFMPRWG